MYDLKYRQKNKLSQSYANTHHLPKKKINNNNKGKEVHSSQ